LHEAVNRIFFFEFLNAISPIFFEKSFKFSKTIFVFDFSFLGGW